MAVKKYWLIKGNEIVNLVAVDADRIGRPGGWKIPEGCELKECIDDDQRDETKRLSVGMKRARKGAQFEMPEKAIK